MRPLPFSPILALLLLTACAGTPAKGNEPPLPPASAPSLPVPTAASATSATSTPAPSPPSGAPSASASSGKPCGPLDCRLFDAPADALAVVLASRPLVLGVGEAHAQKGTAGVDSAAKRFTGQLLPALQGRASDLVVELMLPPKGCQRPEAEKEVRVHQHEVTQHQADTNQSEYVTMGDAARKLGVIPDALRPSCADLEAAAQAGDGAVVKMLETIARLAGAKARELLARNEKLGAEKMVVLYGGALHDKANPKPERAAWSFGPELVRATGGRYVELDVFVPESIQDTDAWKAFAWYPYYDRAALGGGTALFRTGPASWALIFPKTA
jgi:hypothetical protein